MTDPSSPAPGSGPPAPGRRAAPPILAGLSRSQLQLLLIGAVAMALPLCFIVIIFAINFGGLR